MSERTSEREAARTRARRVLVALGILALFAGAVRFYTRSISEHYAYDVVAPPVDLNAAQYDELIGLPGIGDALARRILDERTRAGPFVSGDQLEERVEGIGREKLRWLLQYAVVSAPGE